MNAWQRAREDDNFRQMLRGLGRATVREVDLRDADPPVEQLVRTSRRQAGLGPKVRDYSVIGRVVRSIRAE